MRSGWGWVAVAALSAVAAGGEVRTGATDRPAAGLTVAGLTVGVGEAVALPRNVARRTARRTSRRTTRRTTRRLTALPPGCPLTGAYYYCGGVYYQRVVESGTTYYVVVTP